MGITRSAAQVLPSIKVGKAGFSALFKGFYLLHRDALYRGAAGGEGERVVKFDTAMASSDQESGHSYLVPFVTAVAKGDNPFTQRISVGRANSCDIVFQLSFVSKVHAHFQNPEPDAWTLSDNKSSNGTFVNEIRVEPNATKDLRVGDDVRFGSLTLRFCNGPALYDELVQLVG